MLETLADWYHGASALEVAALFLTALCVVLASILAGYVVNIAWWLL